LAVKLPTPRSAPSRALTPPPFWARISCAAGALLLAASTFSQWGYDRAPEPDRLLLAWGAYPVVGAILVGLAAAVLATLAFRPGWSRFAALGAAVITIALMVMLFSTSAPGRGARWAILASLILIVAAGDVVWSRPEAKPYLRLLLASPVLAIPVWLIAAPLVPMSPGGGTDGSWVTVLNIARERDLDFGTELIYTYGPLGFMTAPRVYDAGLAQVGYAYVMLVYYALATTTIALARRSVHALIAMAVAVVTLEAFRMVSPDEQSQYAVVGLTFMLGALLLCSPRVAESRWWLPLAAAGGAFAGFEALIKLNTGLAVTLVLGVVFLAGGATNRARLLGAATFAGGIIVGFLVSWVAAGQSLGAIDDYLRMSVDVVNGYAAYQYNEEGGRAWEYVAAAVIVPVLVALAWFSSAGWTLLRRAALLVIVGLVLFASFKQGFVRHDAHSLSFFAITMAVAIGLGARDALRTPARLAFALCFVSFIGAAHPLLYEFHRPRGTLNAVRETVRTLRAPETLQQQALDATRGAQAIPPEALTLVGDRPVHFFPTEASVAWTQPQLNWRPLPVFQGFVAYTPELDARNAEMLRSDRAPERLLRTQEYSAFEDPEAVMEVACRYTELFAQGNWQVLARGPNRCGAPELVRRVETSTEEPIPVPPVGDGELLFFRAHGLDFNLRDRVQNLLWKPDERSVFFDGQPGGRLAPTLADKRNLLKVGAASDYSPDFRLGFGVRQLTFRIATHGVLGPQRFRERRITVEFYRAPLTRPGIA
jgi:hypothetical protein